MHYQQKKLTPDEKTQKVLREIAFCDGWKNSTDRELPHWRVVKNEIAGLDSQEKAREAGRLLAEKFRFEFA